MRRPPALLAMLGAAALATSVPSAARGEPAPRRRHGSVGAGGALLLTGAGGDRTRFEVAADLKLGRRLGALAAWRGASGDHSGMLTAGVVLEGGAARPRLVLDLHGELGVDLDARAPVLGGGVRVTLGLAGPLGLVLGSGGYLVLDGIEHTRLQLQTSALLAIRW